MVCAGAAGSSVCNGDSGGPRGKWEMGVTRSDIMGDQ